MAMGILDILGSCTTLPSAKLITHMIYDEFFGSDISRVPKLIHCVSMTAGAQGQCIVLLAKWLQHLILALKDDEIKIYVWGVGLDKRTQREYVRLTCNCPQKTLTFDTDENNYYASHLTRYCLIYYCNSMPWNHFYKLVLLELTKKNRELRCRILATKKIEKCRG